jgi:hypothetical protein
MPGKPNPGSSRQSTDLREVEELTQRHDHLRLAVEAASSAYDLAVGKLKRLEEKRRAAGGAEAEDLERRLPSAQEEAALCVLRLNDLSWELWQVEKRLSWLKDLVRLRGGIPRLLKRKSGRLAESKELETRLEAKRTERVTAECFSRLAQRDLEHTRNTDAEFAEMRKDIGPAEGNARRRLDAQVETVVQETIDHARTAKSRPATIRAEVKALRDRAARV